MLFRSVSDDPDYVTGYVATKEIGYCRITTVKEMGDPCGGRIFLYRGPREGVAETIRYLQKQCVLVEGVPNVPVKAATSAAIPFEEVLGAELREVAEQGLLRVCRERPTEMLSFASNDYQNLAGDPRLKAAACEAILRSGAGAGASRLDRRAHV